MSRIARLLRSFARLVAGFAIVLATVVLVRAFDARRAGPPKPWHTVVPASEMTAGELDEGFSLSHYLAREEVVFREVRTRVESALGPEDREPANRYWSDGPLSPSRLPVDGNRTFELVPEKIRGGVLLVHGLTDAPYSMRRLAEIYRDLGYYALALRMPGHGTVPGALTESTWRDWAAAVRVGARHVRARAGRGTPFHIVGYSNGGALAVDYALDVLDDAQAPASRPPRPRLADDRRRARRGFRPRLRASRRLPVLRDVALARRDARVHPLQVRLLPGKRRHADRGPDRSRSGRRRSAR